jgi:hypothetical protein
MSKKMILASFALIFVLATAIPAYAQTTVPTQTTNQGFFGQIASFFGNMFNHQNGQNGMMQGQGQGMPMQGVTPGQPAPSGGVGPNPSGQPNFQSMQQYRLNKLVNEGKITQAQEQAILTELTTVQNELTTWAQSQGINPDYVLSGPMIVNSGPQGGNQSTGGQQSAQAPVRMYPMFHSKSQSGYGQGQQGGQGGQPGGAQGGQPPMQPQGQ